MRGWLLRCGCALVVTVAAVLAGPAWGQTAAEADKLAADVARLYQAGKYAEAIPIAQRALALREKANGPDHPDVGDSLNNLAGLYQAQGRYAEAEPLNKRALALREKALGPDHPAVGTSLNNLAGLYWDQGRFAEAEPLYKHVLALYERVLGPDHPDVGTSLNNLAVLYRAQGRYAEAEPLYKRALALREKALGPDHPDVGAALSNLAGLYESQGRNGEAAPLYERALALFQKVLGPDHPFVGIALNNLAGLYRAQGRYAEAEPLHKRDLAIGEKALGPDHPAVGTALSNLAGLYWTQGRYAEAEPLFKRALALREKALGPDHPDVGAALSNLAGLYQAQGRYAEAEPLSKRALALREKALGPDHPDVGIALNNLAELYRTQGRYAEAEPLYKRALALREKALGPDHPDVGTSQNNLALLYRAQGRYAEAEPLYKRALALREKALGPDHPEVGKSLDNLAFLALDQSDVAGAAGHWRRATALLQRRAERGLAEAASEASSKGEAQRNSWQFQGLIKTTHRLAVEGRDNAKTQAMEMFQTAQWGTSTGAARALEQMVARSASSSPELAALVRERQDLIAEWSVKDKLLIAAKSAAPNQRNSTSEKTLADRLAAIDARRAAIDEPLAKDFPDYAALVSPKPIAIADVQSILRDDEALVLFLDTDDGFPNMIEESFIWVVTKTDVHWARSNLGTAALQREATALRCGLDATAWSGDGAQRCADLLSLPLDKAPMEREALPFDAGRAHALYKRLFGDIETIIKGKHLLIVPSGALTTLPFQVLVSEPPDPALKGAKRLRQAHWLIRDHALSVLPSVAALKALRCPIKKNGVCEVRPTRATRSMVAFGNPVLDGKVMDPNDASQLDLRRNAARYRRDCSLPLSEGEELLQIASNLLGVTALGATSTAEEIRRWQPVPGTATLLCDIAADPAFKDSTVYLADRATKATLENLSETGELATYKMVQFATHGALAGEVKGIGEPGLILTPPATDTPGDTGYLSASDVTALKLDADWVILSACNTAAGGDEGGEALSGLARAFFYAGARSLLVSHWSVYEQAAVKLVTAAANANSDRKLGRAEALRTAMLQLINNGSDTTVHPAFWAPFVIVGEGGAER